MKEHQELKQEVQQSVAASQEAATRTRDKLAAIWVSIRTHRPLEEIESLEAQRQKQDKS